MRRTPVRQAPPNVRFFVTPLDIVTLSCYEATSPLCPTPMPTPHHNPPHRGRRGEVGEARLTHEGKSHPSSISAPPERAERHQARGKGKARMAQSGHRGWQGRTQRG